MQTKKFNILPAFSGIDWEGRKLTGVHCGTIDFKEGTLIIQDGKLTGGTLIADTTTIKVLHLSDPAAQAQLAGHLASSDFLAADLYPEAQFVITAARSDGNNWYKVSGDLTIKGITHPNSFTAILGIHNNTLTGSGKMTVDRTLYDMKFRTGNFFQNLGDTLIYHAIDLDVHIAAQALPQTGLSKN